MPFESRQFGIPKDAGYPKEYQDASAVSAQAGRAAIADGVASAIFSRRWAELLTRGVAQNPPDVNDGNLIDQWIDELRRMWRQGIDRAKLPYNQAAKLRQVGGAFSTLLWIEFEANNSDGNPAGSLNYFCYAVGDCCLFHVRDGQLLSHFPMVSSKDFGATPTSIGSSKRHGRKWEFEELAGECEPADLFVLATDAIAERLLRQVERKATIEWHRYWEMTPEGFDEWITGLRKDSAIRYDDTTLVILEIGSAADVSDWAESVQAGDGTVVEAVAYPPAPADRADGRDVVAERCAEEQVDEGDDASEEQSETADQHGEMTEEQGESAEQQSESAERPAFTADAPDEGDGKTRTVQAEASDDRRSTEQVDVQADPGDATPDGSPTSDENKSPAEERDEPKPGKEPRVDEAPRGD